MIDMHTHVLCGVDDGARTMEESLALIRMDEEQGVRQIVATPHYDPENSNQREELLLALSRLREKAAEAGLQIQLEQGNEVLYFESMTTHLEQGRILTLGGSSYVLVEFYPTESWQAIQRAVRKLAAAGYRPVLAHVERYQALRSHDAAELIESGAYLQINAGSLEGGPFSQTAGFCKKLLRKGYVDFLGSDMHRSDTRPPRWKTAVKWIRTHLPEAEADALFSGNAADMLRDIEICRACR